jgi:hypothetical protein
MLDDTHELHQVCPWCLAEHDCATPAPGYGSDLVPGALSFCIKCGRFSLFGDALELRRPTREEQWDIDNDASLARIVHGWRHVTTPAVRGT